MYTGYEPGIVCAQVMSPAKHAHRPMTSSTSSALRVPFPGVLAFELRGEGQLVKGEGCRVVGWRIEGCRV